MKNLFAIALLTVGLLPLSACSKQPAAPAQPAATSSTQAATAPTAPAPATELPSAAAEESVAAAPPETVSETEDDAAADQGAATVQPALRLAAAANTPPTSERFKEGTSYRKLVPAQPTTVAPGKVEVVEVFWYGCSHCFTLDPAIESWRNKSKPPYVEFVRVPAMWNDTARLHARLYYTAEALGKLDALHTPLFREMHVKGNQLNTVEKIAAFFKQHGVSAEDFQKTFSSFAVESKLQRADFLNRRYQITSVPTFVVHGKYKTDVSSAGSEPQLFSLIEELAKHEHGG